MTKDEKMARNKNRRTNKFYQPADPVKKSHREAEKNRRYNKALWFNKLQDLMDPQKSRKYKREHILTWTTNRIWALKMNDKIDEISDKGELDDSLMKLEQLVKYKREAARCLENELDVLKSDMNKNDDSDCYTEDTSYMTCQYITPNATTLPPGFNCVDPLQYNPYLTTLYNIQHISPVILSTTNAEEALCSINNDTVSPDVRWDEESIEVIQDVDTDGEKSVEEIGDTREEKLHESMRLQDDDTEDSETIELQLQSVKENEDVDEEDHVGEGNMGERNVEEASVENHPCLQYTSELIQKIIKLDHPETNDG